MGDGESLGGGGGESGGRLGGGGCNPARTVAGRVGERKIASTFSDGTLNLMTFVFLRASCPPSRLAVLGLRCWSKGRLAVCFGGPMDLLELLVILIEVERSFSAGPAVTNGGGEGGGSMNNRGFFGSFRSLSVSLKTSLP